MYKSDGFNKKKTLELKAQSQSTHLWALAIKIPSVEWKEKNGGDFRYTSASLFDIFLTQTSLELQVISELLFLGGLISVEQSEDTYSSLRPSPVMTVISY